MLVNVLGQILGFVGSLCLLLFGMDMLSNGIQKGAGSSLQSLLGKITGNRFSAVLTGIAVTAIIQSSGATTVMVVSFVNAEIINLTQAIGIIFGANIGTTVTAWIVSTFGFSFSIESMAIPLFGFGFVLKYLKRFKIHNFADCFMGFALLFNGLGLLKGALKLNPSSVAFLASFNDLGILGLLIGVFIGAIVTALIHSSSAMTSIVLTMAYNGALTWPLSAAIVMGSNIGSTVDAVMSSINASCNARRTAFVHVAFNVIGTMLALLVFNPFLNLIDMIVPGIPKDNITTHIAMLHTVFNVCATLIFLPFVHQIAYFAEAFIKDKEDESDLHYKFPAILPYTHVSADLYSFQIQKEIAKMSGRVMDMMDDIVTVLEKSHGIDEELYNKTNLDEEYIDEMNDAITHFLQTCSRLPNANHDDRQKFARLIHITASLEDLSDECCSMMHTLLKYTKGKEFDSSSGKAKKIVNYFEQVKIFYEQACTFIALGLSDDDKSMSDAIEERIDQTKKELQKASRKRIEAGADVKSELNYMDLVRKIEKAGDCIYTVVRNISDNSSSLVRTVVTANDIEVDNLSHTVTMQGKELPLTAREFELLSVLMSHRGETLRRDFLLQEVWKYEKNIESRTLDVHIRSLRQKLKSESIIETVRGIGYRIR